MTGRIKESCTNSIRAKCELSLGNKPHLPSSVGPFPAFLLEGEVLLPMNKVGILTLISKEAKLSSMKREQ